MRPCLNKRAFKKCWYILSIGYCGGEKEFEGGKTCLAPSLSVCPRSAGSGVCAYGVKQEYHSGRCGGAELLTSRKLGSRRGGGFREGSPSFFLSGSIWTPSLLEGATPSHKGPSPYLNLFLKCHRHTQKCAF